MTPQDFVLALKTQAAKAAASEVDYYKNLPSKNPPEHLKRFAQWFDRLAESDKETAADLIRYAKEGEVFSLLTYIDNLSFLSGERGRFELFHVDNDGNRTLLNEPEGDLLTDIFNNEG